MPAVGCGDPLQTECFGQRDDRGIDEPEIEIGELSIERRDAGIPFARQVRDEVVALRDGRGTA